VLSEPRQLPDLVARFQHLLGVKLSAINPECRTHESTHGSADFGQMMEPVIECRLHERGRWCDSMSTWKAQTHCGLRIVPTLLARYQRARFSVAPRHGATVPVSVDWHWRSACRRRGPGRASRRVASSMYRLPSCRRIQPRSLAACSCAS